MKQLKNGFGYKDGFVGHINDAIANLAMNNSKFFKQGSGILVACPVCGHVATVLLNTKKKHQTTNCRNCKTYLAVHLKPSGIYKIKSDLGVEEVNGENRRWITRHFKTN